MRIGLLTPGFSRTAEDWAIPALQHFACAMAERHSLHVVSLRYPAAGRYHLCGIPHEAIGGATRFGVRSLFIVAGAVRAVVAAHRRRPFDLLHAFWLDEPGLAAIWAGRLIGRPVVASLGGGELVALDQIGYGTWRSRVRRPLIQRTLAAATLLTAGSHYGRAICLQRGADSNKLHVAPLGVDLTRFRPPPSPPTAPILLQAASLTPIKRQTLLLDMFAQLVRWRPDARLLIAGAGPLQPQLQQQAQRLAIADRVDWLGAVAFSAIDAVYRRATIYLQSSYYESQGMALLEAAASGLAALGTPVGVLPELGGAPPQLDAARLAQTTADRLDDRRVLQHTVAAQRHALTATFGLQRCAARFENLYRLAVACG